MASINHIAGSSRKCGRHFHRDHLHISCGLVLDGSAMLPAATARGSQDDCESVHRVRLNARSGSPSSNLASRSTVTRHTHEKARPQPAQLRVTSVILKGGGKDGKSAEDIGLLLDYLTENLSHPEQRAIAVSQPTFGNKSGRQIQHHRRRDFFCAGDIPHCDLLIRGSLSPPIAVRHHRPDIFP